MPTDPVVGQTVNAVANAGVNAADKIGVFTDINYGRNNKRYLDEALRKVQTLVSNASHLLNECLPGDGIDESSFDWFSQVFGLINNFERGGIVKEIPTEWISVRENIKLFHQNGWYKPANHKPVSFELDWLPSVHRVSPLFWSKIHIGKTSKTTLSEQAKDLISEYNEKLKKDYDEGKLYKKKDPDLTEMNTLVSIASEILNGCPNGSGFETESFGWFIQVMQLIDEFKIVVSIPEPWSRARENIKQFYENDMSKPPKYTKAPAPNWKPLARAEGVTSNQITRVTEKLAISVKELKKNYDDKLEKEYKERTLYKTRPRCQLPDKICDVPFNYRSEEMKKLNRCLHDSEPRITLIYGPGGIGKTTILAEMAKRAQEEKMFRSVVFAEVSRNPDVSRIQEKIAKQLGMSPLPEAKGDDNTRTTALQDKMEELKRVLVILDDVWKNADDILGAIGIRAISGVKVLLGTRRRDLPITGPIETIQIEVLSEEESWSLLCQVAPDAVTNDDIRPFAKKVRDECCGLPLALVVIGKALARKGCDDWGRAVHDLKNSIPTKLEDVESALYKVVKYSYDHLATGNKITGDVFLHCCLFPELEEVYVADLQRHLDNNEEVKSKEPAGRASLFRPASWLGLSRLADPDSSSQPNRQRDLEGEIAASIDTLGNYGLLEKHRRPRGIIIKMHDVVRDVGVFIARKDNYAFITDAGSEEQKFEILGNCKRMSLSNINEGQDSTGLPELHTLLIRGTTLLPDKFFKKLPSSIVVLDLSGSGMKTLPSSMETLKNVQTLLLNGCKTLEKVDEIVKLTKLKVLSLRDTVVKSLPKNNLLLEVLCWENGLAPQAADPEVKGEHFEGKYCKLNELSMDRSITVGAFLAITKLNRLTAVKLYVTNSALSSDNFNLPPTCWKKFTIYNHFGSLNLSLNKNKNLSIKDLPEVKHGVKVLLQEAEEVIINNCFQNATRSEQSTSSPPQQETGIVLTEKTGPGTLRKTSILRVTDCANIRYLTSEDGVKLTELEEMELSSLGILIGIMKPCERAATGNIFGKLRKVTVNSCDEIECVIPEDVHQEVCKTLEVISVRNSKRVQHIFHPEPNYGTPPPGIFVCLKELIVQNCNRLTSLFTTHMAAQLKNLQKLTVEDNSELTEIVSTDASANAVLSEQKTFDCVTHLSLQGLPKLKYFNSSRTNYDWSALVKLNLRACPVLTQLPIGKDSAKRMNIIDLHSSVDDMELYNNLIRKQETLKRFDVWWVKDGKKHTDPVRRNSSALRIA